MPYFDYFYNFDFEFAGEFKTNDQLYDLWTIVYAF